MENFLVNIVLPGAVFLAIIAVILFVASLLIGIFQNIRGSIKLLAALGLLIILFIIGYATASDANPTSIDLASGTIKMISAGIITMLALTVITVVTTVVMSIYNLFK